MKMHDFIYSRESPERYYRHILFWSVGLVFNVLTGIMGVFLQQDSFTPDSLNWLQNGIDLGCEMLYTYFIAYFILPWLSRKKKYISFILVVLALTIAIEGLMFFIDWKFDTSGQPPDLSLIALWGTLWSYTGYGPPAACAVFVILKTIKEYNRTMEEKQTLLRENAEAEVLLLKHQVHPHFLFNTLNNIYSFALTRSRVALQLIESLSSTIRYMSVDCSADLVPLEKEIDMIRDYIQLQQVRYAEPLHVDFRIKGSTEDKLIAPLFLIPLVENCFKHGASLQLDEPWIKLDIFIQERLLRVEIANSKPPSSTRGEKKGIGLVNVGKRLQLLYPGRHVLKIIPAIESFEIHMALPLHSQNLQLSYG